MRKKSSEKSDEETAWQIERQKVWNRLYQGTQRDAFLAQQRAAELQRQAVKQQRQQQAQEVAQRRFEYEKEMLPFRQLEEQREANRIARDTLSELEWQQFQKNLNPEPNVKININYGQGNVYIKK